MNDLEQRVQQNLVRLRKQAGLSQREAEQQLGLRLNSLHDLEKGRLKLGFVQAVDLVQLYRAELKDLLVPETPLAATSPDAAETDIHSAPLQALGVLAGGHHPLLERISTDPVIIAEVGLGQLGKKPLMTLLLNNLTGSQQRSFVLDLYRYINSLIAADGDIRDSEIAMRDTLVRQAPIELSESEKKSIARAFVKPYFGGSFNKSLPRPAYQHFLIWVLHLVARMDGEPHFRARDYIAAVAEHIQLPVSAYRYIEEQIGAEHPGRH